MEQKMRFGLVLGQLAILKNRWGADYEQLLRVVFSSSSNFGPRNRNHRSKTFGHCNHNRRSKTFGYGRTAHVYYLYQGHKWLPNTGGGGK